MAAFFTQFFEHGNFLNIDMSQGSVATCLRCGGIFNSDYFTLISVRVCQWQSFENRSALYEVIGQERIVASFSDSQCICRYKFLITEHRSFTL